MLNYTIYFFAGFVLVAGILAFWFFSGLGFLFLLVFLRSNGRVLDLYRFTRLERRLAEPGPARTTEAHALTPAGQSLPMSGIEPAPQTSQEDDLAISLAATID